MGLVTMQELYDRGLDADEIGDAILEAREDEITKHREEKENEIYDN